MFLDWFIDFVSDGTDPASWFVGELADLFHVGGSVAGDAVLNTLTAGIGTIVLWLYDVLFLTFFDKIAQIGSQLFNQLFDNFCTQDFTWSAIEFACGFMFFVFAVKLAVNIIRG